MWVDSRGMSPSTPSQCLCGRLVLPATWERRQVDPCCIPPHPVLRSRARLVSQHSDHQGHVSQSLDLAESRISVVLANSDQPLLTSGSHFCLNAKASALTCREQIRVCDPAVHDSKAAAAVSAPSSLLGFGSVKVSHFHCVVQKGNCCATLQDEPDHSSISLCLQGAR